MQLIMGYHLKSIAFPTSCSLSNYGHNYTENRCFPFTCAKIKIHVGVGMISRWREEWSHGREGGWNMVFMVNWCLLSMWPTWKGDLLFSSPLDVGCKICNSIKWEI